MKSNCLNLNGYRPSHRNKWWFVSEGILKPQQLMLLEFYTDLMGFDYRNKKRGLVTANFNKIASCFKNSPNTIRGWHKRLLEIGLVKKTEIKGDYYLTCYERYIGPGKWKGKATQYVDLEKNQPAEVMFQNFGINLQAIGQKVQSAVKKSQQKLKTMPSIAISSSKVDSSFIPKRVVVSQPVRTDDEYQRIYDEGGYKYLTPDNMRWIDRNIGVINIKTPTLEENIVEVFFNNDFELYQRSIL